MSKKEAADYSAVRKAELKAQMAELREEMKELSGPPKQTWFNRGFRSGQSIYVCRVEKGQAQAWYEGTVTKPGRKILSLRLVESDPRSQL